MAVSELNARHVSVGEDPKDDTLVVAFGLNLPEPHRSGLPVMCGGGSDLLLSGFPGSQAPFAGNLDQPIFLAGFSVEMMSSRRYESTPTSRCLLRNPGGRSDVASAAGTITGAAVS